MKKKYLYAAVLALPLLPLAAIMMVGATDGAVVNESPAGFFADNANTRPNTFIPKVLGKSQTIDHACPSEEEEGRMRSIELRRYGPDHAADHARARAEICDKARSAELRKTGFTPKEQPVTQGEPAKVGRWSNPIPVPIIPIHAILLPTGKALFLNDDLNESLNRGLAYVWDPIDQTGHFVNPPNNMWCSGHTLLADGRVLVAGGNLQHQIDDIDYRFNPRGEWWSAPPDRRRGRWYPHKERPYEYGYYKGLNQIHTFNPFNETWTRQPDMRHGRWYPTVTLLADGRSVITSGNNEYGNRGINSDVEVFTPSSDMNGKGTLEWIGTREVSDTYPHQFLLPSGKMLMAGPGRQDTAILDPSDWSWSDIPNMLEDRYWYGSGVLLPAEPEGSTEVMMIGGATDKATATTEYFDVAQPEQGWHYRAPLPQPRHNLNTVILPDGTLLTVGGNSARSLYGKPQRQALLYDPATDSWAPMATQRQQRAYHSTALLLPDGRVLSAGDDDMTMRDGINDKLEIFEPPYLFHGPRPEIGSVPNEITWGENFKVDTTSEVARLVLMSPGATTHANNMSQRHVELNFTTDTDGVIAAAPASANIAPPGYYMLFLLSSESVPSVAEWIRIRGK